MKFFTLLIVFALLSCSRSENISYKLENSLRVQLIDYQELNKTINLILSTQETENTDNLKLKKIKIETNILISVIDSITEGLITECEIVNPITVNSDSVSAEYFNKISMIEKPSFYLWGKPDGTSSKNKGHFGVMLQQHLNSYFDVLNRYKSCFKNQSFVFIMKKKYTKNSYSTNQPWTMSLYYRSLISTLVKLQELKNDILLCTYGNTVSLMKNEK